MLITPKYPKGDELKLSQEFDSTDFDCKCTRPDCRVTLVDPRLVKGLDTLILIFPIILIHSGFRCTAHNKQVGGVIHSLHLEGRAADISTPFAGPREVSNAVAKVNELQNGYTWAYENHVHVCVPNEKEIKQNIKGC